MIDITFFKDENHTDKQYEGESTHLVATLDMYDHIKNGGFCMVEVDHVAAMVTKLSQVEVWKTGKIGT